MTRPAVSFWLAPSMPGEMNPMSKLTEDQVREIRRRCASGESHGDVCKDFGVSKVAVRNIHVRKSWKHIE